MVAKTHVSYTAAFNDNPAALERGDVEVLSVQNGRFDIFEPAARGGLLLRHHRRPLRRPFPGEGVSGGLTAGPPRRAGRPVR